MGSFNWQKWADAFGYTNDADGIAAVQHAYGLPTTGVLDDMTVRVVTRLPRCGMTDAQPAQGTVTKWGLPVVAYFVESYPVGLGVTKDQVEATVRAACDAWSAVCGIRFSRAGSSGEANIVLGTGRGSRANFDGPSGTLAWCEIPQGSNFRGQLQMKWDLDEAWTVSKSVNGILLLNVTTHELGHGIGLFHNNQKNQLMNPYYSPAIATPQSYEIAQVVQYYGQPVAAPTPAPTPVTPTAGGAVPKAAKIQMTDGSVWAGTLKQIGSIEEAPEVHV